MSLDIATLIGIILCILTLTFAVYSYWNENNSKGNPLYKRMHLVSLTINMCAQIMLIVSLSSSFISGYGLAFRLGAICDILVISLMLSVVFSDCQMLHLVAAFNPFFTDRKIRIWTVFVVVLFVCCCSLDFFLDFVFLIEGGLDPEDYPKSPYHSALLISNGLILVWGVFAVLYDTTQNIYLAISFFNMSKRRKSEKKELHFRRVLAVIVLGIICDFICIALDVYGSYINPSVYGTCTSYLGAVMGFRTCLITYTYHSMRSILFKKSSQKGELNDAKAVFHAPKGVPGAYKMGSIPVELQAVTQNPMAEVAGSSGKGFE